jgi:hypothetical protein
LAAKEIIGLALEDDKVRGARFLVHKGYLELLDLDTIQLTQPLGMAAEKQEVRAEEEVAAETDDIFNLEDEESETLNMDMDDEDPGSDFEFDMTEEGTSGDEEATNEALLQLMLSNFSEKRANLSLNIPIGETIVQFFDDTDYRKLKKKDLKDFIGDKLASIYDKEIPDEQYRLQIRPDGSLVLASFENPSALLNLVDHTAPVYKGSIRIRDIRPDEMNLIGLVRSNYDLEEDEYTGVIHIGRDNTRMLFMKGGELHSVLPVIQVKSSTKKALDTIFSKILFEIDKGEIPGINRLLITNPAGFGDDARAFFAEQLVDIEVENFQYDGNKITLSEELERNPPNLNGYTCAIAAAWAASGIDDEAFPPFSFLPKYVRDRQQIFKLHWHGVILLMIIAAIPFILNNKYQSEHDTINRLEGEQRIIQTEIHQLRPIAETVEYLFGEVAEGSERLELLQNQNTETLKWSRSLDILNSGMQPISNAWLTSLRSVNEGMIVDGYSLFRDRIPQIARVFHNAQISQVTEGEMRDQRVYRFTILVNNITDDPTLFRAEPPEITEEHIRAIMEETGLMFDESVFNNPEAE